MTYTPRAQRLMKLARIAGDLEFFAYMDCNRERAEHFLRKLYSFTRLAHSAQHGSDA